MCVPEFLRDEDHPQKVQLGSSRLHSLIGAGQTHEKAARVFDDGPVAGTVRFEWDRLRWFEEDEPIYGHPRNPYARVDALRSHRHIRVQLDDVVLADTVAPVLLFETGLPTRYYIDPTDVAFEHLESSDTADAVSVQGHDFGVLVGSGRGHTAPGSGLDVSLPATGRRCDRRPGGVLQREARRHRRRHRVGAPQDALQLTASKRLTCAS